MMDRPRSGSFATYFVGILLLALLSSQKVLAIGRLSQSSGHSGGSSSASQSKGPFEPAWVSIEKNYKTPQWFQQAKFGIFIHWGLYAVPAYHNEMPAHRPGNDALVFRITGFKLQ